MYFNFSAARITCDCFQAPGRAQLEPCDANVLAHEDSNHSASLLARLEAEYQGWEFRGTSYGTVHAYAPGHMVYTPEGYLVRPVSLIKSYF